MSKCINAEMQQCSNGNRSLWIPAVLHSCSLALLHFSHSPLSRPAKGVCYEEHMRLLTDPSGVYIELTEGYDKY
jgi:hypothetical protein